MVSGSGLDAREHRQLDLVRRFGTVGSLLLAVGALGAGASPVFNPLPGIPGLGLFARIPISCLACAYAGMIMVTVAWLWLGLLVRPDRTRLPSHAELVRTIVMWGVPLVFAPPLFSQDVYSYLAQSKIAAIGQNPYLVGPAQALGVADALTRSVPNIWRNSPSPYGPLFLTLGRGITWLVGDHVISGVLLHRLLALCGVAMMIWALPRLARRFGVHPGSALWLGAANPLVLFHLISGIHNEALMVGFMLSGLEVALRHLARVVPGEPFPPTTRRELLGIVLGSVLITLGAAIKIPAALALGFLGVMIARRWGGHFRNLVQSALLLTAVSVLTLTVTTLVSGFGPAWITALGTTGSVPNFMSVMTILGHAGGFIGVLLGLGDATDELISLTGRLGELIVVVICGKLLWDSFRWRRQPMIGLGAGLGTAALLLLPAVQPWYLIWAAPLAAAVGNSRFRTVATAVSVVAALSSVRPTGGTFEGHPYVVLQAIVAALVIVGVGLAVLRTRLPLGLAIWSRADPGPAPNSGSAPLTTASH